MHRKSAFKQAQMETSPDITKVLQARAEASAVDGPTIVNCAVAADALPNIPHIELELAHPLRRREGQGSRDPGHWSIMLAPWSRLDQWNY